VFMLLMTEFKSFFVQLAFLQLLVLCMTSNCMSKNYTIEKEMNKVVLVIGGAGYIGSHTSWLLAQQGYRVVILDLLVHEQPVNLPWATFVQGDFGDAQLLKKIFSQHAIDTVMHFAAFIEVGESVKDPAKYYNNNVIKTIQLLDVMREHAVNKLIFSSSCAVYGNPVRLPLDEEHQTNPVSPYGRTKLMIEYALQDYAAAYGLRYVALRYFNAAGGLTEQGLGEFHKSESHIIPILLAAARNNKPFNIFGTDYNTLDGTCVRDYIHVLDIARAHVQASEYLISGGQSQVLNLGTGIGYSVKELVACAQEVSEAQIQINYGPRRPGDAETLVADATKVARVLGWRPQYSDMREIMRSAHAWQVSVCSKKLERVAI
jgi:UDP-glucose 4-epimerase